MQAGLALAGIVLLASPVRSQVTSEAAALQGRANSGDVDAQNRLGSLLISGGSGVKADAGEALRWFRQAADKGYAPAQYNLGLAYQLGRGVALDERQAFKYFLMAAEQGFAPAQFSVGNQYTEGRGIGQDYFEANLWYKQAADSGLAEAQFNLGLAYELARGVKKDETQAARWYRQATDKGYAPAQYNLALMTEDGRGVAKDGAAAVALYQAAAEQGFAAAQVNYGLILSEGRAGVAKDPVQALVWLSRAAQNGARPDARDALASRLTSGQIAAADRILAGRAPVGAPAAVTASTSASEPVPSAAPANLVNQLREQSRRLAAQVETLTADKEASDRQIALLTVQIKDAQQDLAKVRSSSPASSAAATGDASRLESQITALNSRLDQAVASLKQAQEKNAQLTEANQKLVQEKTGTDASGAASTTGNQTAAMANLQRDNIRLNDEVKRSTRELLSLNAQLRTLQRDAGKPAGATTTSENPAQVTELANPAQQAGAEAERLAGENRRLTARLNELEKVMPKDGADKIPPKAQQQVAELKQQLATLQTEKDELEKWSKSIEANLNQHAAAVKLAESRSADVQQKVGQLQGQLTDRDQALEKQRQASAQALAENKELTTRLAATEERLKASGSAKSDSVAVEALRRQLADGQAKADETERRNAALLEQLAAAVTAGKTAETKLEQVAQELAAMRSAAPRDTDESVRLKAALAAAGQKNGELAAAVADLTRVRNELQGKLAATQGRSTEVSDLKASLAQAKAQSVALQRELTDTRQQSAGASTGTEALKLQLAEANQALDKSSLSVSELTAANARLEKDLTAIKRGATESVAQRDELARARRDLVELGALRDENIRLRKEAADGDDSRTAGDQLKRENAQLTEFLTNNRSDLNKAQARVTELEKQLGNVLTVHTEGGDAARKLQRELEEANRTVEKLNGTVSELTAANEKLEKDMDNAQKSTAAALAAQSQAVSAASPDAFQMEISTLNARLKQLEGQVEEERSNAAREITTLAGQLQKTRETNKSLTDANRALMTAKDSDTSATKDELDRLQARLKELGAANDELRRQGQQQTGNLRTLTFERDSLQSQLVDARKVATTLPGLADEKAALQEKLESVEGQLVQLQKDEEALQKANADLTQQLAASQQATEKAQADIVAVQSKAAEAEKAADTHNASVAELTAANTRFEREREDTRRLVDSYRADIARLTQNVRNAEQQRVDTERGGQQSIDALSAQMSQLRRELEAARSTQSRMAENFAAQDRDRTGTIAQLRTENNALAARLNQAQGTLDQIAAAARLGTPAAAIASGGPAPLRPIAAPAANTPEVRTHTVTEGDSLSRISLRYYGTANRWQEIYQANRDVLQGSSALRVGQQLRIP